MRIFIALIDEFGNTVYNSEKKLVIFDLTEKISNKRSLEIFDVRDHIEKISNQTGERL